MLETFMPYVKRGVSIVGLEPSCLLSLRDEFLQYGYGEDAQQLAQSAFLFEEFLVRERQAERLELPLKAPPDIFFISYTLHENIE
jgi:Fe-S oxidoreductase